MSQTSNFNGFISDAITFRAWDQTIGLNGSLQDASTNGGTTAFSTATDTADLTITALNDRPVITSVIGSGTYVENGSPVFFDTGLTISDLDSSDFDGGTLSTSITANGESDDRLSIVDGNSVTTSGMNVLYDFGSGPVVIGTFTGGDGDSDPLLVNFNINSTLTSIEAVAQQIAFSSLSEDPSTLQRTLEMIVTDGDGGTSTAQTRTSRS